MTPHNLPCVVRKGAYYISVDSLTALIRSLGCDHLNALADAINLAILDAEVSA